MKIYAWKTGASLAVAVAVGYAVLSVLFALWPDSGSAIVDAVTTGTSFREGEMHRWSFGAFIYALALLMLWGFVTGALFAWVHSYLHRSDAR